MVEEVCTLGVRVCVCRAYLPACACACDIALGGGEGEVRVYTARPAVLWLSLDKS